MLQKILIKWFAALFSVCLASPILAAKKDIPGAYLFTYGGPFVVKSDTVNGTDFSTWIAVRTGANYGKGKQFGLNLRLDKMSTKFRQAEASMDSDWTEFNISYRYLWFVPTFIAGHTQLKAKSNDPVVGDILNAVATFTGFGLDLEMPYSGSLLVYTKLSYVNFSASHDFTAQEVKFGSRQEADIGIKLQMPLPALFVQGGYFHRSWSIEIDGGGSKAQVHTGPYVGFLFTREF